MKKIVNIYVVPILLSVLCGFICAKVVFIIYEDNLSNRIISTRVYLLKSGEYNDYNDMRNNNKDRDYLYYIDNNIYKSIVGITKEEGNIEKINKIYNNKLDIEEYYIDNDLLEEKQLELDNKLLNTENDKEIEIILKDILSLYKESSDIEYILNK